MKKSRAVNQIRTSLKGDGEKTISELLRERGIQLPSLCGGSGICGKCRVRYLSSPPSPTETERKVLGDGLIAEGFRLACRSVPRGEAEILCMESSVEERIFAEQSIPAVLTADQVLPEGQASGADRKFPFGQASGADRKLPTDQGVPAEQTAAVDLGTTTIVVSLLDRKSGLVKATVSGINHQRQFGADVISRIDAALRGKGPELQALVRKDLRDLLRSLKADPEKTKLFVSGNTTMQHLLEGLSVEGLGTCPYTPVDISLHEAGQMVMMPGISAFLGADLVSGIVTCGMDRSEELSFLLDLGTNGEMAIGNRHRILAASAAAGPAFEGGSIQWGTAGIPGAISSVEIRQGQALVSTIGGDPPLGICGSGVLEAACELLKAGLIDETGLLTDRYFDTGFPLFGEIVFTASDVREVQLAKSAVRSGIEILLKEYGVSAGDLRHFYIAGGFGQKIDLKKAAEIGLIPGSWAEIAVPLGNASLSGAVLLSGGSVSGERFQRAAGMVREISLSDHGDFNDLFLENMYFRNRQ